MGTDWRRDVCVFVFVRYLCSFEFKAVRINQDECVRVRDFLIRQIVISALCEVYIYQHQHRIVIIVNNITVNKKTEKM